MVIQHGMTRFSRQVHLTALFRANLVLASTKKATWIQLRVRSAPPPDPASARAAGPASGSGGAASARVAPWNLSRDGRRRRSVPGAKMAARCSTRWLLVASPRLPAATGRGARPPRGGVVGASLGRKLSVTALAPSLGGRGSGALLTLRSDVSLTGKGQTPTPEWGLQGLEGRGSPRSSYGDCRVEGAFGPYAELLGETIKQEAERPKWLLRNGKRGRAAWSPRRRW